MRIGHTQLDVLKKKVNSCLPAIEQAIAPRFGNELALALTHIEETTRSSFLESLEDRGFFVQAFTLDGQSGWVYWAPSDARRVIEQSLGCGSAAVADTPLSGLERSLAGGFATEIAAKLSSELGATLVDDERFIEKRILQASIDAAPTDDEQRLSVVLQLSSETFSCEMRFYLPGVKARESQSSRVESPETLPEHLNEIGVELSAELASLELPLQDVLNLEEGDVLALGPRSEMRALLTLNGRAAGTATYGRDGEHLALRVEEFHVNPNN
jgi:flagellar motor switch protein FliM